MHNSKKLIDSYLFKWKCLELPKMELQWQSKKDEKESSFNDLDFKDDWRLPTVDELLKNKNKMQGIYLSSEMIDEENIYGVFIGKGREKIILKKNEIYKVRLCRNKKVSVQ